MRRIYLIFMLSLSIAFVFGQTPITLGNSNMPGSGDTLRYTNIQVSSLGNYTQTGVNFNWNFSNVISTTEGVRSYKNALLTPYAIFFLSANEYGEKVADTVAVGPFVITKYYNYYKKQTSPNAFVADGAGVTFSSVPLPSYYSDKDELYNFPMTYPKYDSTSFKFSTLSTTLIPIKYTKSGYRVTRVDGWGTITTPFGTGNCLRLVTTQYGIDSIKASVGPISIPFGFPNYVRSYQWFTTSSKIPFLEVTGNLVGNNFIVTQARYRGYNIPVDNTGIDPLSGGEAIQLYPNPASDKLLLNTGTGAIDLLSLFDSQGKLIREEKPDSVGMPYFMDVSDLSAGVYFIKTDGDGRQLKFKFIKQ